MDDDGRQFLDGAPGEAPKRAVGRPRYEFNEEIARKICDALASGMTLRQVEKLEGFPGPATIYRWMKTNPDFNEQYHMALHWRAECHADEILEIADDKTGDYNVRAVLGDTDGTTEVVVDGKVVPRGPAMVLTVNRTALGRSQHQVDTRFRLLAKRLPRHYGDHTKLEPAQTLELHVQLPGDGATPIDGMVLVDPLREAIEAWRKK